MAKNPLESAITPEQILAQRDRILASTVFSRSQRQTAFLNHVVSAALEGRADKLKEFALGVDVFEKDETFDPATDSIVRVEASRLRGKLREYYLEEGKCDPVVIEIPKGHYAPAFRLAPVTDTAVRTPARSSRTWFAVVSTVLVISIAFAVFYKPGNDSTAPESKPGRTWSSSIAVLPLRDRSPQPEIYFSEAVTDGLISALAELGRLRVTPLASTRSYKNTNVAMSEIGRTLGVEHIVEGSLIREDGRVGIAAQLFDVRTGSPVWTTEVESQLAGLVSIQYELANGVAEQISDAPIPGSRLPMDPNPAAYEAYMKGRYFFNQFTVAGYVRSMDYFQQAIAIEPNYAEAYAGLASCHCLLAGHGLEIVSPDVAIPQAQAHALRALNLNDKLAEPYAFLGIIDFKFGWDLEAAKTKLIHSIELNPSLFSAYIWLSQLLEATGLHNVAVDRAREAKQLNPLSLAAILNLGWQLSQAGKYIEADTEIDRLIEFSPQFWGGHWAKGTLHNRHRRYDKAIVSFERAVQLQGGHSLPLAALGYTYAIAGRPEDAQRTIEALKKLATEDYVSPFHVATVYAGLNDADLMFEWLERAFEVRARSLAWLQVTLEMQPFHDDPRFQGLLERIGMFSIRDSAAELDPGING